MKKILFLFLSISTLVLFLLGNNKSDFDFNKDLKEFIQNDLYLLLFSCKDLTNVDISTSLNAHNFIDLKTYYFDSNLECFADLDLLSETITPFETGNAFTYFEKYDKILDAKTYLYPTETDSAFLNSENQNKIFLIQSDFYESDERLWKQVLFLRKFDGHTLKVLFIYDKLDKQLLHILRKVEFGYSNLKFYGEDGNFINKLSRIIYKNNLDKD